MLIQKSNKTNLKEYIKKEWYLFLLFIILFLSVVFFFSDPKILIDILKSTIGNSNASPFNRHVYIGVYMAVPLSIIGMFLVEFSLIIGYEKKYGDTSAVDTAKPILYLCNAVIGIFILLFFPWKFISPILTTFTSVLIPIALMNKNNKSEKKNNKDKNMTEFSQEEQNNDKKKKITNSDQNLSGLNKLTYWTVLLSIPGIIIPQLWNRPLGNFLEITSKFFLSLFIISAFGMLGFKIHPNTKKHQNQDEE